MFCKQWKLQACQGICLNYHDQETTYNINMPSNEIQSSAVFGCWYISPLSICSHLKQCEPQLKNLQHTTFNSLSNWEDC